LTIKGNIISEHEYLYNFLSQGIAQNYEPLFLDQLIEMSQALLLMMIIPISISVMIQYQKDQGKIGDFVAALPVTRKKRFWTRTGIGMAVYTIPWLVLVAGVLWLRIQYDGWYQEYFSFSQYGKWLLGNDSIGNLLIFLGYLWIVLTFMYSISVWMQSICFRPWSAALLAMGTTFFPYYLFRIADYFLDFQGTASGWSMEGLMSVLTMAAVPGEQMPVVDHGLNEFVWFKVFQYMIPGYHLWNLIVVLLICASHFQTKIDGANKGKTFFSHGWKKESW
jgi:hypothetical protein